MTTPAHLGTSMVKTLVELKERKGQLNIDDVAEIFTQMAGTLSSSEAEACRMMRTEIENLANYIHQAKADILSIVPGGDGSVENATQELDAVIKATEEASNTIMDMADAIQEAASGVGGEKEEKLMAASTQIYEACNFQDLTSQRITKVISLLNHVDKTVTALTSRFTVSENDMPKLPEKTEEEKLLNGPQLPNQGVSQADIDAMFGNG